MRGGFCKSFAIACCVCLSLPRLCAAQTRELHWKSLDSVAYLDDQGALNVVERQLMVFTGDWNGGERVFHLAPSQTITLRAVTREDPRTGTQYPLNEGDLDRVGHYSQQLDDSGLTVRWRSRLPTDPTFSQTELVYVLDYVITGVLTRSGDTVQLAHDFAFSRPGPIEQLSVRFSADSSWRSHGPPRGVWEARDLAPYLGYIVRAKFSTDAWLPPGRAGQLLLLFATPLSLFLGLLWLERRRGRLRPLESVSITDPKWLALNLFNHPPELVAVLWKWSAPGREAVAALMARLEHEGKIATQLVDGGLQLQLRVERTQLTGYEQAFVAGFFFAGDTTSTAALRAHYRSSGFSPASCLKTPLLDLGRERLGPLRSGWSAVLPSIALVALVALAVVVLVRAPGPWLVPLLPSLFVSVFVWTFGGILAAVWRDRLDWGVLQSAMFVGPTAVPLLLAAALIVAMPYTLTAQHVWGLLCLVIANCSFVFGLACTRESAPGLALRRRLTAIRGAMAMSLRRGDAVPAQLVPYLLGFGLGKSGGEWFVAAPRDSDDAWSDRRRGSSASTQGSSSERSSGPLVGGGGGFGGAGATGAWVSALGDLSGGVAAPSSSSSGSSSSSSGGGSSSSGGGSGGGW